MSPCRHRKKQKEKQEEIKRQRLERKRQLLEAKEDIGLQKLKQDERFNHIDKNRFLHGKQRRNKSTKNTFGK